MELEQNKELHITSDLSEASFLCMRGYTLLGAVDDGSDRMQFVLTHYDLRHDPEAMLRDIVEKKQEFSQPFTYPGDESGRKVTFRDYFIKLRMCKKALANPVSHHMVETM